nr:hypothetical protein [Ulva partita]BAV58323.1 hypothetical protein [Ulva partita]
MNVQFPFPELSCDQYSIRMSDFSPDQLRSADVTSFQYPLFVRLETLADKAAAGHHDLSERIVGAPLTSWIQCQTTCAVVGEPSNIEEDSCKVVRQRIWVHELFYDLQEIYGITEANQASHGEGDFSADCVVCLTNRKNTTVLPCRHFCMCNECAKALLRRTRTCPMCRLPISSVLQIQIQQGPVS